MATEGSPSARCSPRQPGAHRSARCSAPCSPRQRRVSGDPPEVVMLFEAAVAYGVVPLTPGLTTLDPSAASACLEQLYVAIRLVEIGAAPPRPPAIAVACGETFSSPPQVRRPRPTHATGARGRGHRRGTWPLRTWPLRTWSLRTWPLRAWPLRTWLLRMWPLRSYQHARRAHPAPAAANARLAATPLFLASSQAPPPLQSVQPLLLEALTAAIGRQLDPDVLRQLADENRSTAATAAAAAAVDLDGLPRLGSRPASLASAATSGPRSASTSVAPPPAGGGSAAGASAPELAQQARLAVTDRYAAGPLRSRRVLPLHTPRLATGHAASCTCTRRISPPPHVSTSCAVDTHGPHCRCRRRTRRARTRRCCSSTA